MSTPPAPTLAQQYPDLYREWVSAGGIDDNFRAHVLAVQGTPAPTPADVAWLIGHVNSSFGELQLALAKAKLISSGVSSQIVVVSQTG